MFHRLFGEDSAPSASELLERANAAIRGGEYESAARLAHEIADNPDGYPGVCRADALTMLAIVERRRGSLVRASQYIGEALAIDRSRPGPRREYGMVLMWLGRMAEADVVLSRLCRDFETDARAWLRLGYVRMWTSTISAADSCFARAHEIEPEIIVPYRTGEKDFDARVIREWEAIPVMFRSQLDASGEMQVRTAALPTVAAIRAGEKPLLRGYCETMTSSIVLFHRLTELGCSDSDSLQAQVRRTLRHEVGHALGMTEEEVAGLGLGPS